MRGVLIALLACVVTAGLGFGAGWKVHSWRAGAAEVKVVTQYVDRVIKQGEVTQASSAKAEAAQARIRTVYRDIIKEVPTYVSEEASARCTVPLGFVRLHDAAAQGSALPEPAGEPHDAPSGVELPAVAETVAGNYGTCNGARQQLIDLQDWITAQRALAAGG